MLKFKKIATIWTRKKNVLNACHETNYLFFFFRNPTPSKDTALGIPSWPPLKSNNLQYLDINNTLTIKKNPQKYIEIKKVLDQYMQEPFNVY